jgi:hypothetical protein
LRQVVGHHRNRASYAGDGNRFWIDSPMRDTLSEKAARQPEMDATKATAHLPGLEIEIVHRFTPGGEQISIHLQAMPSFEAFGRFLEASNPLAFWGEVARLA